MHTILKDYVPVIISVFALGVSALSYYEARRQNNLETIPLYHISAEIAQDLPVEIIDVNNPLPVTTFFEDVADPNYHLGMVTFWIHVRVTNIGVRSFSISKVESAANIVKRGPNLTTIYFDGMFRGTFFPSDQPLSLPLLIDPGRQEQFYVKVAWPVTQEIIEALSGTLLEGDYSFVSVTRLLQRKNLSFIDTPPRNGYFLIGRGTNVKLEMEIAGEQDAVIREVYFP